MRVPPVFALSAVLLCVACGGDRVRPQAGDAGPGDFIQVREFGWLTSLRQPQPAWHPSSRVLAARGREGLVLYHEGGRSPTVYSYNDKRQPYDPRWINAGELVFGPEPAVRRGADGRLLLPREGLRVTTYSRNGLSEPRDLSEAGYRPRPWGRRGIVASAADNIYIYNSRGRRELFEVGFDPEPDPWGPGLAWRDKPFGRPDYWTEVEGLGNLYIRWGANAVKRLPRAVEPAWCPWGGLVATVIDEPDPPGKIAAEPSAPATPASGSEAVRDAVAARQGGAVLPVDPPDATPPSTDWWTPGTTVVYVPGPDAEPVVIGEGLRNPAPHPTEPVIAAVDRDGAVVLVACGTGERRVNTIDPAGLRPVWSPDGTRLLYEQETDNPVVRYLAVSVFRIVD